jgi:hypothetical protein
LTQFHLQAADGVYEFRLSASPDVIYPHVHAHRDTGKLVRALIKVPAGTILVGAGSEVTWREYASLWQKVVGVPARYKQTSKEEMIAHFPLGIGQNAVEMMLYTDEFGWDGGKPNILRPKDVSDPTSKRNSHMMMKLRITTNCLQSIYRLG